MYIANPIYDVVFKYMMEDNKVARKFISTIIGEQIEELEFAPQETTLALFEKTETTVNYTVCRLDFLAKINTASGCKTVIIEVQKAKMPTDIMRFRRYLGTQYQDANNSYKDSGKVRARQIYCIFFLGDKLGIDGVPVIEINHKAKDRTTNEELPDLHNEFIDSLHHRSWIVQVPELPQRRRNEIEILLSVFDQSHRFIDNHHVLDISEMDFPKEFRPVIRRLQQALESPNIKNQMNAEDDYIEYFKMNERELDDRNKTISELQQANSELQQANLEKDKIIFAITQSLSELQQTNSKITQSLSELQQTNSKITQSLSEKDRAFEEMQREFAELKRLLSSTQEIK